MPSSVMNCPACSEQSKDFKWCEHCGHALSASDESLQAVWLEKGSHVCAHVDTSVLGFTDQAQLIEVDFEIIELLMDYQSRRIFTARANTVTVMDDDPQFASAVEKHIHKYLYIIEENGAAEHAEHVTIPDEIEHLVRCPLVRGQHGEHALTIFVDNAGMTLDEIVELCHGRLSFEQVREIFLSVLDLVESLHHVGYVHLKLAPWHIRILDEDRPDGFPQRLISIRDDAGWHANGTFQPDYSGGNTGADTPKSSDDTVDEVFTEADFLSQVSESDFDERDATQVDLTVSDVAGILEDASDHTSPLRIDEPRFKAIFDVSGKFYSLKTPIDSDVPVTMGYSAPELVGKVELPIDESADVFALGMILYYLLTARTPPVSIYTSYTPVVTARHFREGFPYGLQSVISRAVRSHPAERYPNLVTMREAFLDACHLVERRSTTNSRTAPDVRVAADRHVGISKRRRNPENQDHVFAESSTDGQFALLAVADGVSTASYGTGEIASQILADEVQQMWAELLVGYENGESIPVEDSIQRILSRANQRIVDYVNKYFQPFSGNPHEVMGSTVVIAVYYEGEVTLASLGDSRAYLQTLAGLEQLTTDHNLWTLSLLDGMAADSALSMPHGGALAQCLGSFSVDNGVLVSIPPQPDVSRVQVAKGDTLLLTTDGLIDFSGDDPIDAEDSVLAVLVSEPEPALACLELIVLANRGGGGDNIGVAVARFG